MLLFGKGVLKLFWTTTTKQEWIERFLLLNHNGQTYIYRWSEVHSMFVSGEITLFLQSSKMKFMKTMQVMACESAKEYKKCAKMEI